MVGWHHCLDGHEFEQIWELVMDREACRAAVHGVTKSRTRLSDFTSLTSRAGKGPSREPQVSTISSLSCVEVQERGHGQVPPVPPPFCSSSPIAISTVLTSHGS